MFCSQCGTAVSDSAKFCNSCGSRLGEEEVKVADHEAVAPQPTASVESSKGYKHAVATGGNHKEPQIVKNMVQIGGSLQSCICLHCGFKGDMTVDTVIAPGHESWKAALIGGILFSILILSLLSDGVSPIALVIPLALFLISAYLHSQKLECFHCSSCHEISYKSNNGTWSTEKDTRKWYWKNWSDSSLPSYQKVILFAVTVCVVGFIRYLSR